MSGATIDLRRGNKLLLIGGVPRSGKTKLARAVWSTVGVPGFMLDAMIATFTLLAPNSDVGWEETPERANALATAARLHATVGLRNFGSYFIEGESLTPAIASVLREEFQVKTCFLTLGQPNIETIIKYELDEPWVTDLDKSEHAKFRDDLISRSQWLVEQCKHFGFPWIDMSVGNYADRIRDAIGLLIEGEVITLEPIAVPQP